MQNRDLHPLMPRHTSFSRLLPLCETCARTYLDRQKHVNQVIIGRESFVEVQHNAPSKVAINVVPQVDEASGSHEWQKHRGSLTVIVVVEGVCR